MFNEAMKTLAVAQHINPLDRLPSASDAREMLTEDVLIQILADDVQTSTGLVEIIKAQILAGMENTTNRRGESLEVAMRADSLARLVSAWATVSNVRSNRAAQVAALLEKRAQGEGELSFGQMMERMMKQTMEQRNERGGISLDELESAASDAPINYKKRATQPDDSNQDAENF